MKADALNELSDSLLLWKSLPADSEVIVFLVDDLVLNPKKHAA